MRIDKDASARLWAERLGKLQDAIDLDGGEVFTNTDSGETVVIKGDSAWSTLGRDFSDILEGE